MTAPHLAILASAFPPVIGGAETYAAVVADGMASRGLRVTVITDRVGDAPAIEQRSAGPIVRRLSGYLDALSDATKIRWEQLAFGINAELTTVFDDDPPDVILANNLETTITGRMLTHQYETRLIGSYHEHAPEDEPLGSGKLRLAYSTLAPDLVLAGGKRYFERALRFLDKSRVRLIHHGVDTDAFHPTRTAVGTRQRLGASPGDLLIVSAGRFKERKGQLVTLEAFARLRDRPGLRLVLAGTASSASAEYEGLIRSRTEQGDVRGRVHIAEDMSYADMPDLMAAADIVVQPSLEEGLGLAILEGMSAGRPVITSFVPGIDEILTRPGIATIVDPRDSDQLAAAVDGLAVNASLRRTIGDAGRAHVEAAFSQTQMLDATYEAICEVLR